MAPRKEFESEERKPPSKRNWERRPERGDDQPRERKPAKPKGPDDVVWDWEDDLNLEDNDLEGDEAVDKEEDQDDVVWDDDDR